VRKPFVALTDGRVGAAALAIVWACAAHAGPFPPAAGQPGSTAIPQGSASFIGWATGYFDYSPGGNVDAEWRTPAKALGPAVGDAFDVVTLGDGGRITLTFDPPIGDGPGADFAVFENAFDGAFLELAWVEVSSDNVHYFRFPGISLTANPVPGFGSIDPTNIDGFAGKYRQGFGTPFDLALLRNVPGLDVSAVRYVRITDITGDGSVRDAIGQPVYDPYPTVGSGGFDLDAVGVIHQTQAPPAEQVPMPASAAVLLAAALTAIALRRLAAARGRAA
jgi:hypothetical protein